MHQLTSLTLTTSSDATRRLELEHYSRLEELKNIVQILLILAPVLRRLEISGDLIDLQVLEWTAWPNLSALRIIDHIPHSVLRPIVAVISGMPMLQTLACDFKAEETPRPSYIFCPVHPYTHLYLSSVLPGLSSLSVSNLQPGEQIVYQLPKGLRDLRVVALRDPHVLTIGDFTIEPRYNYSALSDDDASLWINAASELPHLSKLTLHLKSIPSPELLEHIARACPGLQYLELEQACFEHNYNEASDFMLELLVTPLASLLQLKELRLSVELGPALVWVEGVSQRLPSPAFEARVQAVGTLFAAKLQSLEFLGFSALNLDRATYGRDSIWYMLKIVRNEDGLSLRVMDPI
ncbi:hypothetical protein C0992_004762 [Termitomyces sp. T32_za158]|nr:hypothetical protein C0992_004762 [Termitomyces sp. T32_za158]